jgi:hypothetical protein
LLSRLSAAIRSGLCSATPRSYQQPFGWHNEKTTTDMPSVVNLRQDPFERTPSLRGQSWHDSALGHVNGFCAREFWRFVEVRQKVFALAETAVNFPPMQAPASFNLGSVKRQIDEVMKESEGR